MGKIKSRTSQTSKGERRSVSRSITKAVRLAREIESPFRKIQAQLNAWKRGRNVVLTIANPNKNETNKPYIKARAWDIWGNPNGQTKKA
jgi:hypothetical protein